MRQRRVFQYFLLSDARGRNEARKVVTETIGWPSCNMPIRGKYCSRTWFACLLRVPNWQLLLWVAAQDAELGSALRPRIPSPPIASASVHSSPTLSIDSSSTAIFAVPWRTIQKQAVAAWQPLPVEVVDERRTNPPPGRSSRPISDQGVWGYRPRSPQTRSSRTHLRPSLPSVACPYWTRSGSMRSPQALPG